MIGPYLIACALLVVAGASKVVRPADTVRALGQISPHPRLLRAAVPVLAAAECALGAVAFIRPGLAVAVAVAASFAAFTVVVLAVRQRGGPLSTCGCFGTPDTPATWWHAAINGLLALACAGWAVKPSGGSIGSILRAQPWDGLPLLVAVAIGTWLVVLVFTRLAQLTAVRAALASRPGGTLP
jgi:hypothetical protein